MINKRFKGILVLALLMVLILNTAFSHAQSGVQNPASTSSQSNAQNQVAFNSETLNKLNRDIRVCLLPPDSSISSGVISFDGEHAIKNGDNFKNTAHKIVLGASYKVTYIEGFCEMSSEEFQNTDQIIDKIASGSPILINKNSVSLINPNIQPTENIAKIFQNSKIVKLNHIAVYQNDVLKYIIESKSVKIDSQNGFFNYYNTRYRGGIYFATASMALIPVNSLSIESYLYGVVPKEMPSTWHIEALKAQAVAARSYASKKMLESEAKDFDVYPTTDSQVYAGVAAEKDITNRAVDDTSSEILIYGDEIVTAFYSASNGGFIEGGDGFSDKSPYLKAKVDPYTNGDPHMNWTKSYKMSDLTQMFNSRDYALGDIKNIEIVSTSQSGRASQVKVSGSEKNVILTGNRFRSVIGYTDLKSSLFKILTPSGTINSQTPQIYYITAGGGYVSLPSAPVILSKSGQSTLKDSEAKNLIVQTKEGVKTISNGVSTQNVVSGEIKFVGSGYGHGVGLSQHGAKAMADAGNNYKQILSFYYDGSEIYKRNN